MKLKTSELEKLKAKLPRGYRMELWRRLGKPSTSAIDSVLRGDYSNAEIIEAAVQLAEEHQNDVKATSERISNL